MTAEKASRASATRLPSALRTAQAAIHLPEVQAMLRRLREFELGIFMPHQHDARTVEFQPLPDDVMQVESSGKVSFQRMQEFAGHADRHLAVAWRWQAGAPTPASTCEMDLDDAPGGAERPVKHKMPGCD